MDFGVQTIETRTPGLASELVGQGLDDAGSQARLGRLRSVGHPDAVVANRQGPPLAMRAVVDIDLPIAIVRKGVLERVDHEFGDDKAQADGLAR